MKSDGIKPRLVDECQSRTNWSKWKEAIQVELDSLKRKKCLDLWFLHPPM